MRHFFIYFKDPGQTHTHTHTVTQSHVSIISVSVWGLQQSWQDRPLWHLASSRSHCQPEDCTNTSIRLL